MVKLFLKRFDFICSIQIIAFLAVITPLLNFCKDQKPKVNTFSKFMKSFVENIELFLIEHFVRNAMFVGPIVCDLAALPYVLCKMSEKRSNFNRCGMVFWHSMLTWTENVIYVHTKQTKRTRDLLCYR